jgi:flagellar protein FliS
MTYGARQVVRYREAEVASASPGQLVVIIYDHLLVNLKRARMLLAPNELTARSDALERARAALTELLVTLDRERGGEIAARLASLYTFMLAELSVLGVKPSAERLDAIVAIAAELRAAFDTAARVAAPAAACAV